MWKSFFFRPFLFCMELNTYLCSRIRWRIGAVDSQSLTDFRIFIVSNKLTTL